MEFAVNTIMDELRRLYIEIGKKVQKYDYDGFTGILNKIMFQIKCIDSDEDFELKKEYLKESYGEIFGFQGGLGNFVIYEEDRELCDKLNTEFLENAGKIWDIIESL